MLPEYLEADEVATMTSVASDPLVTVAPLFGCSLYHLAPPTYAYPRLRTEAV